jgi:hypothetical protein
MAEHSPEIVDRHFFVRKAEECIRHADEESTVVTRVYWLQLADRWLRLAEHDSLDTI